MNSVSPFMLEMTTASRVALSVIWSMVFLRVIWAQRGALDLPTEQRAQAVHWNTLGLASMAIAIIFFYNVGELLSVNYMISQNDRLALEGIGTALNVFSGCSFLTVLDIREGEKSRAFYAYFATAAFTFGALIAI